MSDFVDRVRNEIRKSLRSPENIYLGYEELHQARELAREYAIYDARPSEERNKFMGLDVYLVNSDSHLRVI